MKFLHTVLSSWIVGAVFVIGVSGWFLLKRREKEFALASMKIAACTGMVASLLTLYSGDKSAYQVAQYQPMKLAAMEALYEGGTRQPLTVVGEWKIPTMLSFFWPHGIPTVTYRESTTSWREDIRQTTAPRLCPPQKKIARGKMAIAALSDFRQAQKDGDQDKMDASRRTLEENMPYLGYGYIQNPDDLVPNVGLSFWTFRIMVGFGMYFIAFFRLGSFPVMEK